MPLTEAALIADVKKLLACERKQARSDVSSVEEKLIKAEIVLLIIAVIALILMPLFRFGEGPLSAGTLVPNFGLAALRMKLR